MKEWHFYDKVYRVWVVLVIGTPDEFKDFMSGSGYKHTEELSYDLAGGMCIRLYPDDNTTGQNCSVIWLGKYETSTLIHELSHLVMYVLDDCGINISRENTETFAFYLEHWFTEITKVRRKFPNGRTPAQVKKGK